MTMIKSIKIGKLINSQLTSNEQLTSLIGENKVFPIVAPNETQFPFCVYQRSNATPYRLTKDGIPCDTVTFTVIVASDSYFESVDVAQAVREALEVPHMSNSELAMHDTYMVSISESYEAATYIQQMQFTTRVGGVV